MPRALFLGSMMEPLLASGWNEGLEMAWSRMEGRNENGEEFFFLRNQENEEMFDYRVSKGGVQGEGVTDWGSP